jgi:hypothetical protein
VLAAESAGAIGAIVGALVVVGALGVAAGVLCVPAELEGGDTGPLCAAGAGALPELDVLGDPEGELEGVLDADVVPEAEVEGVLDAVVGPEGEVEGALGVGVGLAKAMLGAEEEPDPDCSDGCFDEAARGSEARFGGVPAEPLDAGGSGAGATGAAYTTGAGGGGAMLCSTGAAASAAASACTAGPLGNEFGGAALGPVGSSE